VLAYRFTENRQFAANTDRNYVFLSPNLHILDQLYLIAPYMSFYVFSKNLFFAQNRKVLAYHFTENRQLAEKTHRNSIFVGRDTIFRIGYT
jgi:hypothetical protein